MPSGRVVALSMLALAALLGGCLGSGKDGEAGPMDLSSTGPAGPGADSSSASSSDPVEAQPAPTVSPAPFSMAGTGCKEILLIVPITEAQAREFVPASYTLLGGAGQATGFIGLKECADLTLDGASIGAASTSDVGVLVDKGEPGVFHYYQAWWTTDNALLWGHLQAQGWYGGLANDTLDPFAGAVGVGEVSALVGYGLASYTISVQLAGGSVPADNHAVGWFDAPNGTVTVDKVLHGTRLASGKGTVTGDGDAARLFGSPTTGTGLWNEYAMDATVGA
jgi:hypothetical protein